MVLSRHGTRSFPSSASSTPKGFSEPNLTANLWGLARRPQDAPCFFPKAASLMHYIGFFPSHMECVKCLNSSSLIEMERWQPTVSCWRLAEGKKKMIRPFLDMIARGAGAKIEISALITCEINMYASPRKEGYLGNN